MNFNEKIKNRREQLGFTQLEVANYLHVTRQTISKWELGKSYPDLELLVSLSEYYDLSLDELLKENKQILKFFNTNSTETNTQQLISSLINLIFWMFFLVLLIISWLDINTKDSFIRYMILIFATVTNGSLFILSLTSVIQILFHKEKKHIKEKKKTLDTYSLNNKKNIYQTLGLILMLISLWLLTYETIKLSILIPIYLLGLMSNLYAFKIDRKISGPSTNNRLFGKRNEKTRRPIK